MKNILVLGAGLVSRPGIKYLLASEGFKVTVADLVRDKAETLVRGHRNGVALGLDINDDRKLREAVKTHDIVVSLLPWTLHLRVAVLCIEFGKHMATTSYVSEGMRALDAEVRSRGLLFMNETGVDPGIDHMSAKKIIDHVRGEGGIVSGFYSYCGGLPAPENNDNPFGYKFSWSPRGVILASRNSARFLKDGKVVDIPGEELFLNYHREHVEGLGDFEVYPNRDSLIYRELYGLDDAGTIIRGTYRYPGWCSTFKKISDLGLLSENPVKGIKNASFKSIMAGLTGTEESGDIKSKVAEICNVQPDSDEIGRMEWLGLFSDEPSSGKDNYLDILSDLLMKKLFYKEGEKDMILLKHRFDVINRDGSKDRITSTLIDYGIPGGDSSMSRTVSLPLAITVRMMAEGRFDLKGVHIPVMPQVYNPVLSELEKNGIKMTEVRTAL